MIPIRDFFNELKEENFKPITYGIFNRMYDDGKIDKLESLYKEPLSVEDFKYFDFDLTDKEKFLVKMYNKEYLKNVKKLKNIFLDNDNIIIYVDHEYGIVRVVKLNKITL